MNRGALTLFKDIFVIEPERHIDVRRGRSHTHHQRRNECITDRYYFHARFSEKRYDIILNILSEEFFLSQHTIPDLLSHNYSQLKELNRSKPTREFFRKKWPHLVWN